MRPGRRAARAWALALLLAAGGCGAAGQRPPPGAAGPVVENAGGQAPAAPVRPGGEPAPALPGAALPGATNRVLARFDGREIRESELARVFFRDFREQAWAALSRMIGREIAEREASRAGILVPPDWLARTQAELAVKLEQEAAVAWGIRADVARYTAARYKQTEAERLEVLLANERERYLFSRVIRFQALRSDRAELEMIVVDDAGVAAEIASNLDAGADFARLAERHSVHDSGAQGGRLPPLPAEALQPAVASRVSALRPGERTGVLEVDDGSGRRQFEIVRLVRLIPGRDLTWEAAREEIEADLAERPVDLFEWTAWFLLLERLYKVTLSDNV